MVPNNWSPSETLLEFAHWCSEYRRWSYDMSITTADDIYQAVQEFGVAKGLGAVSEEWMRTRGDRGEHNASY